MQQELRSLNPDWPEPVETLNETGGSDIVLLCEHASNHVPGDYRGLGLEPAEFDRHIAWDIGAAELTRRLSSRLNAPAFLGTYSRLLIDVNRPLDSATSIPVRSESTDIPGNAGIDAAERVRRAGFAFEPFHERISRHLDLRARHERATRIVTIHSFTPIFLGVSRPWHAGVLYADARQFGEALIAALRKDSSLNVEANVPYVISRDSDYAVPVHGDDRAIPAILVEVRQYLLSTSTAIDEWAERLALALPEAARA
jgi:predicted N-formylglutamate amidohydrolase